MRGRQSASSPGNSATKRRRVETSPSPSTRGSSVRKASRPSRRSRLAGSAVDPTSPVSLRPSELSNTPDSLIDRVSAIAAVPVETVAPITSGDGHPDYVTRDFLTKAYGYAPGSLVHKHKANATSFARRNVLFPQWVQNPGLPVEPGQAGTILTMRVDILEFRSLTLFVRAPVKTAMWLYMGEYEPVVCPTPLTNTEFQNLTNATRTGWAKCILGHWQQWDSFMSARTRIWLRKNGKAVTDASVTETLARHRAGKVKGGDIGLDKQDVLKAFDSGEECTFYVLYRTTSLSRRTCTPAAFARHPTAHLPGARLRTRKGTSLLMSPSPHHHHGDSCGGAAAPHPLDVKRITLCPS
ncbi:hypothetical protein BC834DRAFT_883685 [Gloeopeniophorella convolvens]|nr:hypothetical protein BC834DRAFT_883685 [Gloeopeniophorella convolvens]